jgi:3-oxoacyl-[acyl-carrier-protein] synthase II
MNIHGIGIISSVGRGLEVHRRALAGPLPTVTDGFCRIQDNDLKDPVLTKDARRASRFDRLAILAGLDAVKDAAIQTNAPSATVGLILATALGPHVTTFRFLDDMINFDEKDVSPTLFSHSVHNAAASYISSLAGLRGPTLTITRFSSAFQEALTLSCAWLEQKRCDFVLVGAADELGAVMQEVLKLRSIDSKFTLGEGAAFFVLSQTPSGKNYGSIGPIQNAMNIASLDDQHGLTEALFGCQPCQSAFSAAAAALLLSAPIITGGEI